MMNDDIGGLGGDGYDDPSGSDDDLDSKPKSDEFAKMLEESFSSPSKKFSVGDKVKGEILVLGKEDVFVSIGGGGGSGGRSRDGIVSRRDMVDLESKLAAAPDPSNLKVGDKLDLYVTMVKGAEIRLSPNKTSKNMADDLEDAFDMMIPIDGKVVEVCKGGVRVSIKGKIAFCPISQLDSKRVETGEEYIGRSLPFLITKFAEGGRNIVVSRRKLLDDERELSAGSFFEEHKEGSIVAGRVARIEKFGAFIEVAPGIDGLAHVSELAWSRVNDPAEVLTVGQEMPVKILRIEPASAENGGKMRLSLSIKQAGAEPWAALPASIQPGQMVEGKVTRCAKFGAFVELVPGIEGLIPLGEMSHTKRVMRAEDVVKEGERITVLIKDVNPETKRISLSLKDAGEDPWAAIASKFPVGSIHKGKVERREGYGIFVKLEDGITGLLPKSKASESPEYPFDRLRINDETTVQIAEIRRDERRISLQPPKEEGDWKGFAATQSQATSSLGTLGGAFGAALQKAIKTKK